MTRDLPALRAAVEASDEGADVIDATDISARCGLDAQLTQRALRALATEDPPFLTALLDPSGNVLAVTKITGHARRAVGTWPAPIHGDSLPAEPDDRVHPTPSRTTAKKRLRTAVRIVGSLAFVLLSKIVSAFVVNHAGNHD